MAHKVKPGSFADKRRGTRQERGYGAAWDKARRETLRDDGGLCQPCLRAGRVTPNCNTVDHVINKAEWQRRHGTLDGVDAPSNRQTICAPCHRAKTQTEAARARAGGVEKSTAPLHRTELIGEFMRAQVSGVGGVKS